MLKIVDPQTDQQNGQEAEVAFQVTTAIRGTPESNATETHAEVTVITDSADAEIDIAKVEKETKADITKNWLKSLRIEEIIEIMKNPETDTETFIFASFIFSQKLYGARELEKAVANYRELLQFLEKLDQSEEIKNYILKAQGRLCTTEIKIMKIRHIPIDYEKLARPFNEKLEDETSSPKTKRTAAKALAAIYQYSNEKAKTIHYQEEVVRFSTTQEQNHSSNLELERIQNQDPELGLLVEKHRDLVKQLTIELKTGTLEKALDVANELATTEAERPTSKHPAPETSKNIRLIEICIQIKNHKLSPSSETIQSEDLPEIRKMLEHAGYVNEAYQCLLAFGKKCPDLVTEETGRKEKDLSLTTQFLLNPKKINLKNLKAKQLVGIKKVLENAGYIESALRITERLIELCSNLSLSHMLEINLNNQALLKKRLKERSVPGAKYILDEDRIALRIWNPIAHVDILYPNKRRKVPPATANQTIPRDTSSPENQQRQTPPPKAIKEEQVQAKPVHAKQVEKPQTLAQEPEKESAYKAIHGWLIDLKSRFLTGKHKQKGGNKGVQVEIPSQLTEELLRQLDDILEKHSRGIQEICIESLGITGEDMLRNMITRKLREEISQGKLLPRFIEQLITLIEEVE